MDCPASWLLAWPGPDGAAWVVLVGAPILALLAAPWLGAYGCAVLLLRSVDEPPNAGPFVLEEVEFVDRP